jgi:hypothetical protein
MTMPSVGLFVGCLLFGCAGFFGARAFLTHQTARVAAAPHGDEPEIAATPPRQAPSPSPSLARPRALDLTATRREPERRLVPVPTSLTPLQDLVVRGSGAAEDLKGDAFTLFQNLSAACLRTMNLPAEAQLEFRYHLQSSSTQAQITELALGRVINGPGLDAQTTSCLDRVLPGPHLLHPRHPKIRYPHKLDSDETLAVNVGLFCRAK